MLAFGRWSFRGKLDTAVLDRLQLGQSRAALVSELSARLSPSQANRVVSRAEARLRKGMSSPRRRDRTETIFLALVIGWSIALIFQNFAILLGALKSRNSYGLDSEPAKFLCFSVFNMAALIVSAACFAIRTTLVSSASCACAVLFAFPFSHFLLWRVLAPGFVRTESWPSPASLLSLSALGSYGSAALIYWLYRRARVSLRVVPPRADIFE